jgi:methyl-accepting chemotaxis protein
MIVICDKCGLKYKVDPSKIKGDAARLTCKGCSYVITVDKPDIADDPFVMDTAPSIDTEEIKVSQSLYDPNAAEKMHSVTQPQEKKRSGFGLTAKVIMMMLLASLIPGAVYFVISFKQTDQYIKEGTNRSGSQVTQVLVENVDEWVDKNVRVLNTAAQLPGMVSMNRESQEIILKAIQKEYPWIYLVHTMGTNGLNVGRSDGTELQDYTGRQYLEDVKGGKALAWQNVIGQTSKKPALVLAVPIKNNDQVVGVLAAAMSLEAISKIVLDWHQGKTGQIFIVDQDGKVIAHQHEKLVQEQKDLSKYPLVVAAQNHASSMIEFKDLNNKDAIGFSRKTQLKWTLAMQQEKSEAFAALQKARTFAFILLAATVIGIVVIAYFASRAIVMPIKKLTEAANRISVGELSVEISKPSQDEIGDLADAIVRMQDSIRLSIERLRRKKR